MIYLVGLCAAIGAVFLTYYGMLAFCWVAEAIWQHWKRRGK